MNRTSKQVFIWRVQVITAHNDLTSFKTNSAMISKLFSYR